MVGFLTAISLEMDDKAIYLIFFTPFGINAVFSISFMESPSSDNEMSVFNTDCLVYRERICRMKDKQS